MLKRILPIVALLVVACSAVFLFGPSRQDKADHVLLRAQSWWQEQQPHEMYVPPPVDMTDEPIALSTPLATPLATPTATMRPGNENSTANTSATPTVKPTSTTKPSLAIAPAPPQLRLTNFKH